MLSVTQNLSLFHNLLVLDFTVYVPVYFRMAGLTCELRNETFGKHENKNASDNMEIHSKHLLFIRHMLFLDLVISAVY